jgi:hypothetical protein
MAMDSDTAPTDSTAINYPVASLRSDRSREFEIFWRNLPKDGLVPHRRDMKPARAASLLRDIVMLEARFGEKPSLRIRLIGSSMQERIQSNITGLDYLDFRPSEYRAATIDAVRLMSGQPCGVWQVMAMHYERGFAQYFELTAFPLLGDDADVPLILGLMHPTGGLVRAVPVGDKPIMTDIATTYDYIDIGAGKPVRMS